MADQNPTADPRVVPLDLPPVQTEILRDEILGWLAGIEEDLKTDQLPDPDADAREAMSRAAEGYDEASGYERVVAVHEAHHAPLGRPILARLRRAYARF